MKKYKKKTLTEEHKQNISLASKRTWKNEEFKKRMSNIHKGKKHTEETKKRMGQSQRGKKHSEETKRKISESKKGNIPWNTGLTKETDERVKRLAENEERKKKIGRASKGRKLSKEARDKHSQIMINWHKTVGHSEQTKMRISKTLKANPVRALLGKHLSEETKEKIRIKRRFQVFPIEDTSIEKKLQEKLREEKINFETHKPVYGQPDIAILNNGIKIAIFCDGCWWHSCPRCYSKLNNRQLQRRYKDKYVTQKLIEEGWVVLRFWEHEINNNIVNCITKIKNVML